MYHIFVMCWVFVTHHYICVGQQRIAFPPFLHFCIFCTFCRFWLFCDFGVILLCDTVNIQLKGTNWFNLASCTFTPFLSFHTVKPRFLHPVFHHSLITWMPLRGTILVVAQMSWNRGYLHTWLDAYKMYHRCVVARDFLRKLYPVYRYCSQFPVWKQPTTRHDSNISPKQVPWTGDDCMMHK